MFKGIYKAAGHAMTIDNLGEIRSWKYWDALPGQGINKSEISSLSEKAREDFICGIQNKLSESVNLRMMSDVPIGVFCLVVSILLLMCTYESIYEQACRYFYSWL